MIKHRLKTYPGDLLEFDIHLFEVPSSVGEPGEERPLYAGEQVFFITDKDKNGKYISITQADLHFVISSVDLSPGQYPFRAGVILSGGEKQTVFGPDESVIEVRSV